MPSSASPSARKRFDYASLDAETSQLVQQHTGEIRVLMKRTAQSIIEVGQKLIEVKERLGHGRFGDWLATEFDWDERTARRFMGVAESLTDQLDKLSEINFAPSALYILAAPSTPEVARSEAIARAKAGEPITYTLAKELKQKYTTPPTESKPEPEPDKTPPPLPQSGSKLEIVAIRPQGQVPVLEEATRLIVPQPSPPASAPEQPGVWWRLGGRHLLYCGDPNSPEFLERITQKVGLLFAFPPIPDWLPAIRAKARIIVDEFLPQGRNLEQLDEFLESSVLFNSNLGDLVVSCFIPEPQILSIINRLDRHGLFAEPNSKRCNAVISDWKKAGLKVERLTQ